MLAWQVSMKYYTDRAHFTQVLPTTLLSGVTASEMTASFPMKTIQGSSLEVVNVYQVKREDIKNQQLASFTPHEITTFRPVCRGLLEAC